MAERSAFVPRSFVPDDPEVGAGETFVNRAVNMLPAGRAITDTLSTAVMQGAKALGVGESGVKFTPQAQAELDAQGVQRQPNAIPGVVDTYRDMRDTRAQRTAAGSKQNPWAGRAGALTGFGLSLLAPGPKAPGVGLGSSVATGAGYGALAGLTDGKADLTKGEFGQALVDTAEGAAFGGVMGAAGHGLMEVGKRGVRALRGARADTLAQETMAAREAAEAGQAAAAKAAEGERKMIGSAREMNKKVDAQHARELLRQARGVGGGGRTPTGAVDDPGTNALQGMSAKARQAQMSRSKEVERLQQQMGDMDLPTNVAADRQAYIDAMPKAAERGPQADPAGLRRDFVEQYLHQRFPNDPERVARIMRERVGPGADILPRPAAPAVADDVAAAADDVAGPSLAEEAEAAMAARRSEEQLPLLPSLERVPTNAGARPADAPWLPSAQPVQRQGPLTAPPTVRPGAGGMPYGGNLRRPLPPEEPVTQLATQSMAAPRDAALPPEPTRAVTVPNIQRPAPAPRPPPQPMPQAEPVTANPGPVAPPAPPPMPARPVEEIQDVTRLAGPQDVGALAAERAAGREAGAFGAVARAGYEGVRSGNSVLGAVFGGLAGIRREALKDPVVKARVLAAAKVHLLAQINPEVFAKMGGQLAQSAVGGEGQYNATRYVFARRDQAFREAEQKASEQASRMSDEQLMDLIAGGPPPQ
jgi:hypothetical protein